jgi:uncharacterized protein
MTVLLSEFPKGLLRRELFVGIVSSVSATQARLNLSAAEQPSGSHFESGRYGCGEVGELVLIEGQVDLVLARMIDVRVAEPERWDIGRAGTASPREVSGFVQFLGTVRSDTLHVSAGVANYPRLGDRVYAAPHAFVGRIPHLMEKSESANQPVQLKIGTVSGRADAEVVVRPEKLFGRHCAILGATGGGKSWTVSKLIEECLAHRSKLVLLDATGEYRDLSERVVHCHLGTPVFKATTSTLCRIPPSSFVESDFIALFEPSGKVQGPKLREAMRSLRLAKLIGEASGLVEDGMIKKAKRSKKDYTAAAKEHFAKIEDPNAEFDVLKLEHQLNHECVRDGSDGRWGETDEGALTWCLPLRTRIAAIVRSPAFSPVFSNEGSSLEDVLREFLDSEEQRVLRVCMGGVSYEFRAREFIANAIGRRLLLAARDGKFLHAPLVAIVDEAHNFLGHSVGYEESNVRLDAFELIAREGRKYGLNLCLATQRPRDLTEGVLSQIGTLIVHRLTNDRDREIVERACGEVDRSATAFLANLRQGEAAIVGVDFPIPLTVQIGRPKVPPRSDGPNYQQAWKRGGP